MKKILLLLVCSLLLTSCGKTKFDQLPAEKKAQIQAEFTAVAKANIAEFVKIGFANLGNDKKLEEESEKMKIKVMAEYEVLKQKYPEVDFTDITNESLVRLDNSRDENGVKKEHRVFKKGEYGPMTKDGDENQKIQIKITDIVWKGKKLDLDYMSYDAENEFLAIRFESENIGKKPTFFPLSNAILITKDGYEFNSSRTLQIKGCISCDSNPGDVDVEDVIFDIKKVDLAGAKIRFDNAVSDFEL